VEVVGDIALAVEPVTTRQLDPAEARLDLADRLSLLDAQEIE
jgi:hypothetical protein